MITYRLGQQQQGKPNALSYRSCLAPKEGDVVYDQQYDTIFKLENLWLQALLVILENKTLF